MVGDPMTAFGWGTGWRNICHISERVSHCMLNRYGICFAKLLHLGRFSTESLLVRAGQLRNACPGSPTHAI
jgi:hypothetical protein